MFNKYYQQELNALREMGAEFSRAHPALAPMLSGPASDPDVERLLEGVAFLTGLLRQKLDDEFPEVVHGLTNLLWPHYLKPIPSTTMIAFSPKATLKQSIRIPAGIHLASVPVGGTACVYRTTFDVEMHPLALLDASFQQLSGKPPQIKLLFELSGLKLDAWKPESLRFYLAGEYPAATDLYMLLRRHLRGIFLSPVGKGGSASLEPECLNPCGFSDNEPLFQYPNRSFSGYRILQEYFLAPEKFLFLDLTGLDRWERRGDGNRFELRFEFGDLPFSPPRVRKESFALHTTPAVNLFAHEADPILLDHRQPAYLVRPTGGNPAHFQIYSVDRVAGFLQGTAQERPYTSFETFNPETMDVASYRTSLRASPSGTGQDVYLEVAYPPQAGSPVTETLSIRLTCTNGSLADSLKAVDVRMATADSPEYAEFTNITQPTPGAVPILGGKVLWRLVSHLGLNYQSLGSKENLKAILDLYMLAEGRDRAVTQANRKRIDGIQEVESVSADRIVSGTPIRGQEFILSLRQDHYAGPGDLFLFGCVLDHFLGCYASINHFTRTTVREVMKGDVYRWPARIGNRPLT
ncbi:MAG: type VI secretion system baseplate subunit TssF [Deltaproteobacteria bacterium]|nr:MAG: type VI secretion system baseplate subunit TssF [Deltaproteobacteria bacterium]